MSHAPLSDNDYQRLADTLARFRALGAMSLETLDGFFTALLCGPEPIKPAEVLPLILGEAFDDEEAFHTEKQLEQFVSLLMGHWLDIAHTLHAGEPFQPWLDADEHGVVHGNAWAEGFSEGMELLNDDWGLLFEDEEQAQALVPIMALAFEHHPDSEMRPYLETVDPAQRGEWLAAISPSVGAIYRFFAAVREQMAAEIAEAEAENTAPEGEAAKPARAAGKTSPSAKPARKGRHR
ncbi:YecA family protein [Crenobacter cavernae]|uniref:YecA family protein n=1 Tax=Crenobacter cavernae TaxID=2290923 RepID=A0A345Y7J9_9NEIS|nr:YecA family protein [Crenobacter cavernae]AXK39901.1 YecA family protein [Crenobacter cavernae]